MKGVELMKSDRGSEEVNRTETRQKKHKETQIMTFSVCET